MRSPYEEMSMSRWSKLIEALKQLEALEKQKEKILVRFPELRSAANNTPPSTVLEERPVRRARRKRTAVERKARSKRRKQI